MGQRLRVFYSNRVERLYEELKSRLFVKPSTPFTKRIVIVPSPAMKNWLTTAIADDPDLGIAAGIRVTYLDAAVREIIQTHAIDPGRFPKQKSELRLSLEIESQIRKVVETPKELRDSLWEPLLKYLSFKDNPGRGARRITSLSNKLANLFVTYGNFGHQMLRRWKKGQDSHWQAELWRHTVNEVLPENFSWKTGDTVVHLFAISFIPKQLHDLFQSLAETLPVSYYLHSPCRAYWSDILSDKECVNLMRYWEKEGAPEAQRIALEEVLFDRNPLLANLGKVGRETALQVETSGVDVVEGYVCAESVESSALYQSLIGPELDFVDMGDELCLLTALQTDLLLMRNPRDGERFDLNRDDSIQLHVAGSPMREMEGVYDILMNIIHKHSEDEDPILPEDIVVMAPDITTYEPYIRAVFSRYDSKLDYNLMDINILSHHSTVKGFLQLIALSQSRWDVSSVIRLFEVSAFQEKHNLSLEDVSRIQSWIQAADIRWGEDAGHRNELLMRDYGKESFMEDSPSGTWKLAIDRLLMGMAMIIPEECDAVDKIPILPLNVLDTSQTELFGRWIKLMRSLKKDLMPLAVDKKMTLKRWSLHLQYLLETYLETPDNGAKESEKFQVLQRFFDELRLEQKCEKEVYAFGAIKYLLEQALCKQRICYRESHLHAVRFCSMLPMRALPAKVVVLIGMSEEEYPRGDHVQSLDRLKGSSDSDYSPSMPEFDRYLFLETILSARRYFITTYTGYSKKDGKERHPSLLVSELFNYLDSGFTINGKDPSDYCFKRHPFLPYDKTLFEEGSEIPSYSSMYYRAAKAYYGKEEKLTPHNFVPRYEIKLAPEIDEVEWVDVKQLSQMARNPVKVFLNGLGIYLKETDDPQKRNEEDFILENLDQGLMVKHSIKGPAEKILSLAEKEGRLPIGPFKPFSIEKVQRKVQDIQARLTKLGVSSDEVFDIVFSEQFTTPEKLKEGGWNLPPLELSCQGKSVKVYGKLLGVTPKGMTAYIEGKKGDILKAWPECLVYQCLVEKYELPLEKDLICLKSGDAKKPFVEPGPALEKYLDYYFHALRNISPLLPEWVSTLLSEDVDLFEQKIASSLSDKNRSFFNEYVKWIARGKVNPDHHSIYLNWKKIAEEQFGGIIENWGAGKRGGMS